MPQEKGVNPRQEREQLPSTPSKNLCRPETEEAAKKKEKVTG